MSLLAWSPPDIVKKVNSAKELEWLLANIWCSLKILEKKMFISNLNIFIRFEKSCLIFLISTTLWKSHIKRAVNFFCFILTENEVISDQRAIAMSLIIVLVANFYWLASNVFIRLSAQIYSSICMFSLSVHCHPRFSRRLY